MSFFFFLFLVELSPNCLKIVWFIYCLTSQDAKKRKIIDGPFAKNWQERGKKKRKKNDVFYMV